VSAVRASQLFGCCRYGQARAELLRLEPGSLGQLAARYPGRETKVVLDLGRCASLTAGRDCLDPEGVEPFRSRIEGGGDPGGAGADHDDVAEGRRRPRGAEAERPSQLGVAWIAQDLAAAGNHHRRLIRLNSEPSKQSVRLFVLLEVDPLMRHAASGQELAQATRVG